MPHHHDRAAAEPAEPADDGLVLGEVAVARHGREVLDQRVNEIEAVGPLGMARDKRLLPRRELGVGVDQSGARLLLQLLDLLRDRDLALVVFERAQLGDLAFELGDGLLEVEIGSDGNRAIQVGSRSGCGD